MIIQGVTLRNINVHDSSFNSNGALLYLDAGQSASYPGSGTTWTDLSGNGRNGTLTSGPAYSRADGGSIVFDGANDYVQCSGSPTVTAATFLVWMRRNGPQDDYDGILYSRGAAATGIGLQDCTMPHSLAHKCYRTTMQTEPLMGYNTRYNKYTIR